jgi:hypothetical protein
VRLHTAAVAAREIGHEHLPAHSPC